MKLNSASKGAAGINNKDDIPIIFLTGKAILKKVTGLAYLCKYFIILF